MAKKDKSSKGKHAAQKPSKGVFGGKDATSGKEGNSKFSTASTTSKWSAKSWNQDGSDAADLPFENGSGVGTYESTAVSDFQEKRRKRSKRAKVAGITLGVIVALVAVLYFAGVWFFSSHFYPNTTIGDTDVSLMTADAVASDLEAQAQDYTLQVSGQGLDFEVKTDDDAFNIDADAIASSALGSVSAWEWPYRITQTHDCSEYVTYGYDEKKLTELVEKQVKAANKGATDPVDATIAYDESLGSFAVQEEELGTKLDADRVLAVIAEAATQLQSEVEIGEDELKQPEVTSDDERLAKAALAANEYLGADFTLTLSDTEVAHVDSAQVAAWVVLNKDLEPSLSKKKISKWVSSLADTLDTVGTTRTYTRGDGTSITVSGGDYGWQIDQDSLESKVKKAVKNAEQGAISIPCTQTANAYDADGADIGSRYVDVDLSEQHARFYVDGELVWQADVVTGADDGEHNTPTGVYSINSKASPSTLIGQTDSETNEPEYETEVSYWMPFVGNAIGFHDATWQSAFGGTRYQNGYGSHGCVNLSLTKAGNLYSLIQVGDTVIVHS